MFTKYTFHCLKIFGVMKRKISNNLNSGTAYGDVMDLYFLKFENWCIDKFT